MFPFIVEMIPVLVPILFFLTIQERFHWLLLVGFTVQVTEYDIDDGIILNFPLAPDEDVSYSIQYASPMTYLFLLSDLDPVDKGFSAYSVVIKFLLCEVENLVTYLVMTFNDYPSVSAAKSVTYRKVLIATITFIF